MSCKATCKARPAGIVAAIALVAFVVFARRAGHFFGEAALMVAVAAAAAGAAVAAAFAFAAFLTARREQPRRLRLVSAPEHSRADPRWPDRPIVRAESASRQAPGPASHRGQRERTGSTALSFALGACDLPGAPVPAPTKGWSGSGPRSCAITTTPKTNT